MIDSLDALRKALRGSNPRFRGIILYEGPSLLDGKPIVAIANKILSASKNEKTGAMIQSFIIRSDIKPHHALRDGSDISICGNCKHRPYLIAQGESDSTPCYVQVAKSVLAVFLAYQNGRYARAGVDFDAKLLPMLFAGLPFRLGTYGDPTAVPFQAWRRATLLSSFRNGYVHQWLDPRFAAFKTLCMASVDSIEEMRQAHAMGWRTFRVRDTLEDLEKGIEAMCPASKEAGYKTDCASCKACGGLGAKAKVSMAIFPHGIGASLPLAA
jgi:hypothetical protein